METGPYIIRKFEERDRQQIREICCDRGFLGKSIDSIFCDRELFAHMIVDPYLDLEPEHTFVGDNNGEVVGYFMGSTNPNFAMKIAPYTIETAAKMLWRMHTGKYNHHPRSKRFVRWVLTRGLVEVPANPKGYAQFHMNLRGDYTGNGPKILKEVEEMLKQEGVRGYFGRMFIYNGRSERGYAHFGLKAFARKKTTMFEPETTGKKIFRVCVVKDF